MPDLTVQQAVMSYLYKLDAADLEALTALVKEGKNITDGAGGGGVTNPLVLTAGATTLSIEAVEGSPSGINANANFLIKTSDGADITIDADSVGSYLSLEGRAGIGLDTSSGDNFSDIHCYLPSGANFIVELNGDYVLELDSSGGAVRIGFFGTAPVVKPTGVAVTAGGIHAALVSLGLIGA